MRQNLHLIHHPPMCLPIVEFQSCQIQSTLQMFERRGRNLEGEKREKKGIVWRRESQSEKSKSIALDGGLQVILQTIRLRQ